MHILKESTNLMLEVSILIQNAVSNMEENGDKFLEGTQANYVRSQYPSFLQDYSYVLHATQDLLKRYPRIEAVNRNIKSGYLFRLTLTFDTLELDELSYRMFLMSNFRTIAINFQDLNDKDTEGLIEEADKLVASDDSFDPVKVFNFVSKLEADSDKKFEIVRFFSEINEFYQDYIEFCHHMELLYCMFQQKYQYLIDLRIDKDGAPKYITDWEVERWIDTDLDAVNKQVCTYVYSLVHMFGMMIKISEHGVGNLVIKGIFTDEFGENESKVKYNQTKVHHQLIALGDTKRLQIFTLLQSRPYYARELADALSLSPSTISHHIEYLTSSGLIKLRTQGKRYYYALNTDELKDLANYFAELAQKGED